MNDLSNSTAKAILSDWDDQMPLQLLRIEHICGPLFEKKHGSLYPDQHAIKAELLILDTNSETIVHVEVKARTCVYSYREGKIYAGDPQNPAKFFVERFYDPFMSADALKRLFAITIYQAHKVNPLISGLEMLVYDKHSKKISTDPLAIPRLIEHARSADKTLNDMIF